MDKLRAVEYFIKVADTGSFTAAAKSLRVPASSVSRRIQDLEAELGATLLNRTTRVVRLTELGTLYLDQIRPAVSAFDHAGEVVRDHPTSPSGSLRITATPGYGGFRLIPALKKLRRRYPDLVVDLELTDQVSNLAGDDVDLAVRATAELPDRAIARKLTDDAYVLVASAAYLDQSGVPETLADLNSHRTLLYRGPGSIVNWQALTDTGWVELHTHPAFICNVGGELVAEAMTGSGLALLPKWGIEEQLASGALQPILLTDAKLSLSRRDNAGIYLLYHQPKYRLNKIKVTVDFLLAELTD